MKAKLLRLSETLVSPSESLLSLSKRSMVIYRRRKKTIAPVSFDWNQAATITNQYVFSNYHI
jgi:hypothetical protein